MLVKSFTLLAFLCGSLAYALEEFVENLDIELPDFPNCGLRNKQPEIVNKILNDNYNDETQFAEFPWMMAIFKKEFEFKKFICGGSLLSRRVVLTSAHNIWNIKVEDLHVRAGEWDLQVENEFLTHQDRRVIRKSLHQQFSRAGLHNDIALLLVDHPFDYQENVKPICLPPAYQRFDNTRCLVTGWGKGKFVNESQNHAILKKVELPIVPHYPCQNKLRQSSLGYRFVLHSSFVCAGGEEGKDSCKGDGGSPLVCPIPGSPDHFYQVGIVSWGVGCGKNNVPGVYTNVAFLRRWIDTTVRGWSSEL